MAVRCCPGLLLAGLLLLIVSTSASGEPGACQFAQEQGGITFHVDRLSENERCRISDVVADYSTHGIIGPRQTPIEWSVYRFLITNPPIASSLVRQLELGRYEIVARGENTWWADDGEGTQGLITLTDQYGPTRIYYMEGYHDGRIFGRVYAQAVVFMNAKPGEREESAETTLALYTRLDEQHWILRNLIKPLRPFLARTVNKIVEKAFAVADALGTRMKEHPDEVAQVAASLAPSESVEVEELTALLRGSRR